MTTTTTTTRPLDPICPSWCMGHDEKFQAWEALTSGGPSRDHAHDYLPIFGRADIGVSICRSEYESIGLDLPEVIIFTGSDSAALTPAQARVYAARIIEAAETAEREMGANA